MDLAEADRIITSSILGTNEILRAADFPARPCDRLRWPIAGSRLRVEFMLSKLDLALTFCRMVRSKPSEHTNRLLRSARNTLFDGMHFVCRSELAACELEAIEERLTKLSGEFEEFPAQS